MRRARDGLQPLEPHPLHPVVPRLRSRVGRLDGLRRRSIEGLELKAGERLLIVGAGSGLDLPLLPAGLSVLATDLTLAMLAHARANPGVAIVPDPVACLRERPHPSRRTSPGGSATFFASRERRCGSPPTSTRGAASSASSVCGGCELAPRPRCSAIRPFTIGSAALPPTTGSLR